jgi:hypothetical protein
VGEGAVVPAEAVDEVLEFVEGGEGDVFGEGFGGGVFGVGLVGGTRRDRSGRETTRMMRSVLLTKRWRPEVSMRRREMRPLESLVLWIMRLVEVSRMLR